MPIYEYNCQKCGTFETTQKITEKPLTRCPTCKGKVKKLISNTSFQLKGTGWYVTDYARKENGKGAGKGENGAKSSTESKESKDTKSGAKAESKTESSSGKKRKVLFHTQLHVGLTASKFGPHDAAFSRVNKQAAVSTAACLFHAGTL